MKSYYYCNEFLQMSGYLTIRLGHFPSGIPWFTYNVIAGFQSRLNTRVHLELISQFIISSDVSRSLRVFLKCQDRSNFRSSERLITQLHSFLSYTVFFLLSFLLLVPRLRKSLLCGRLMTTLRTTSVLYQTNMEMQST